MKRVLTFLFVIAVILGFSMQAHAALEFRGTDSLGNRLIYDSDFNITWYDFTNMDSTWYNQVNWASGLTVSGGNLVGAYDDWRLPTTVDGTYGWGYDGTTTGGYNVTSSEMGHLFYSELGNKGYYDTSGNYQSDFGLTNSGDFRNLQSVNYWSGTEYSADPANGAGLFDAELGHQGYEDKDNSHFAVAVRTGDVTVVPEPISSILFVTGGTLLAGRRYLREKKKA